MANVTDLGQVRLERQVDETVQSMHEIMRAALASAMSDIAVLHGESPEWAERKTEIVVAIVTGMHETLAKPLAVPLPESLTDADQETVKRALKSWAAGVTQGCQEAFLNRLLELLQP